MGMLAGRRDRKAREAAARYARAAWEKRDRDFDYQRRDLEWIIGHPEQSTNRTLSWVYGVRLVPRDEAMKDLKPIVGNAVVQTHNVMLTTPDTRRIVLMSWDFDNCEELVVTDDDRGVAFVTGRDDGSELVMLMGPDDYLGWLTRVGWTCHREGVQAAIKLIDSMQLEHHRNRPSGYGTVHA